MAEPASSRRWRALFLLAVGAVIGIAFGMVSAFKGSDPYTSVLPDEAIALVNGKPITTEDYARGVALLASDKRTEITEADRAYVLARLIDEELLIHHGIASGLVETDRAIRKAITQAMLAAIVTEHTSELPSDDVLYSFYKENLSLFVRAPAEQGGQITAGGVEEPPSFDDLKDQIEEAYLQRARDEALREYLAWLRSEAEIVLQPAILSSPIEEEGQDGTYGQ
jgi:4-amino-4-deoxy-L-arabinose transferase-like glycosyltransferase